MKHKDDPEGTRTAAPAAQSAPGASKSELRPGMRQPIDVTPRHRLSGLSVWFGISAVVLVIAAGTLAARWFLPDDSEGPVRLPGVVYERDAAPPLDPAFEESAPGVDPEPALSSAIDRHPVATRGVLTADYAAFLTALDWELAVLGVTQDGRLQAGAPPPESLVQLASSQGAQSAVDAVMTYVRATGQLPPTVRATLRAFFATHPLIRSADDDGPAYSAGAIGVALEMPANDTWPALLLGNEGLGRWRGAPTQGSHKHREWIEPPLAVVALKAAGRPEAELLRTWTSAQSPHAALAGVFPERAAFSPHPDGMLLFVPTTAPAPQGAMLHGLGWEGGRQGRIVIPAAERPDAGTAHAGPDAGADHSTPGITFVVPRLTGLLVLSLPDGRSARLAPPLLF